jgi:hypothetical protein
MTIVLIVLLSLAGFALLSVIGGYIFYYSWARKSGKALSSQERAVCKTLVQNHKAYPFLCALVVKEGKCPCLPCSKLAKGMEAG